MFLFGKDMPIEKRIELIMEEQIIRATGIATDSETIEIFEKRRFKPIREFIKKGELPEGRYLDVPLIPKYFNGEIIREKDLIIFIAPGHLIKAGRNCYLVDPWVWILEIRRSDEIDCRAIGLNETHPLGYHVDEEPEMDYYEEEEHLMSYCCKGWEGYCYRGNYYTAEFADRFGECELPSL